MNKICNQCQYRRANNREDGFECSEAGYRINDYGHFQQGARCIHDTDILSDLFEPKGEIDRELERIIASKVYIKKELIEAQRMNSVYKERLLRVEND